MAKRPYLQALNTDSDLNGLGISLSRTLIEQTYAELRNDIIEGRLEPGSKLPIEHLRVQYNVGAGTLREAITRLASDALVTTEGQRGFRVAPIAIEELEDITRLRVHVEIEALRLSIRNGGAHWRAALRHSYEAISALEQPIDPAHRRQWETLNVRFHEALLSGNDSPWTQKVLGLLARHGERYRRYAMGCPARCATCMPSTPRSSSMPWPAVKHAQPWLLKPISAPHPICWRRHCALAS